jgi:hypothetical protein
MGTDSQDNIRVVPEKGGFAIILQFGRELTIKLPCGSEDLFLRAAQAVVEMRKKIEARAQELERPEEVNVDGLAQTIHYE